MYKITILSIGKTKEAWLIEAIESYSKRLRQIVSIHWLFAKNNEQLIKLSQKEEPFVVLDPKGKGYTSEQFSSWMIQTLAAQGSSMSILIGGATGLPPEVVRRAKKIISFSSLTFTHQLTRLILLEQLYRAFEIQKNSPYHK